MTSLQLGLIAAGTVLVVGVVVYNWLQMRRLRRQLKGARSTIADSPARRRSSSAADDTFRR